MSDIEFTGERFVPGQGGARIGYEHLHRYLFAMRWAHGRDVLDVAAGSGYGSGLLAGCASRVWGVDLDSAATRHARGTYPNRNTLFLQGDATSLPIRTASVDVVTAFEVLEHLRDQESLLQELARVCRRDGLVLISTPNKKIYSDARAYQNPFHTREFYRHEFVELLGAHFCNVVLLHQQLRAGSLVDGGPGDEVEVLTAPPPQGRPGSPEPMYFLAVCGQAALPGRLPRDSAYLDLTDALIREWSREVETGNREIARLNDEIRRLGQWAEELDRELAKRDLGIRSLQEEMAVRIRDRDRSIKELQDQFEERTRWALSLEQEVEERDDRLGRTNAALDEAAAHLARIRHAFMYRALCRLRILPG